MVAAKHEPTNRKRLAAEINCNLLFVLFHFLFSGSSKPGLRKYDLYSTSFWHPFLLSLFSTTRYKLHYENLPMPVFSAVKVENFIRIYIVLLRGGSNEYPQSMFWNKNKKKGILSHTPVLLIKLGVQWGMHVTDVLSR